MRNKIVRGRLIAILVALAGMLCAPTAVTAETVAAMPGNKGFITIQQILDTSCSACHDWTGSYEGITGNGHVVAGSPEKSVLYQRIASDEMPASGDKLTADQKAFIKGWIVAGAPATELAISVPAANTTTAAAPAASPGFLFFPSKVVFHEVTGFTSTALLLGAGIIGGLHLLDMMSDPAAHGSGIFEPAGEGGGGDQTTGIMTIWGNQQSLRWWHVGLLVAGETLYIGDTLTGTSMFTKQQPGKLTKHDIHRYAFFIHAGLMLAQVGLGFAETYALQNGQHDMASSVGVAHTVIGLAIPVVMLGAGLENIFLPE
jgi:hypothetical protein